MDIETQIIKDYKEFIINNSIFGELLENNKTILPNSPQSFSKFPTIIIKEANNTSNTFATTLDRIEYANNLVYQVDIYARDVKIGNTKYAARTVMNELKQLTFEFFRKMGFNRETGTRRDMMDISTQSYVALFSGRINSWNMKLN